MSQRFKKFASAAYGYSMTRLALNYYSYFEDLPEEEPLEILTRADEDFHRVLGAYLAGESPAGAVRDLREMIRGEMEVLSTYVDAFHIYEYVLNRAERRFLEKPAPAGPEDEVMLDRLIQYISSAGSPGEMTERIQEIVGQLPVRFTRQKFYSIVREALMAYVGSDKSSLDQMMYLLDSSAMTGVEARENSHYPGLAGAYAALGEIPFKELDAEGYRDAVQKVGCATEELYTYTDTFRMLGDMVNDLYVVCLTEADALRDQAEDAHVRSVLGGLYGQHERGKCDGIRQEITDELIFLEGIQERCYEQYRRMEDAARWEGESAGQAETARQVELLLSDSPFARLERDGEQRTVEEADIDAAVELLTARMDPLLSASARPVGRAVMANVLESLPIFLRNLEDVESYIRNALAVCTDPAEKETCKELLEQLMESGEYALV